MAIVKPGSLAGSRAEIARTVTATDSATIDNTTFVPADAIDASGFQSILVFPRFTNGTAPTVTIQMLYLATVEDGESNSWAVGTKTSALTEGKAEQIDVYGRKCFLRVDAIGGTPDSVDLCVAGWNPLRYDGPKAH